MKKLLLIVLAAGLMFSCQKNIDETPQFQDVSFTALEITPSSGLKSTDDWECKADIPTHAWVVIGNQNYYPELFELDGVLYTQALKLPVGNYCITSFILYKEVNGVEGYQAQTTDVVVFGTPQPGSLYLPYITLAYRFPYCFNVTAFTKVELPIEVLCYLDADYDAFGFDWFAITEIVIREQCFFGDFCIKHTADYHGSNYINQTTWPGDVPFWDAPAIIEVHVSKQTQAGWTPVMYSPFTNNTADAGYGVGAPVCIQYPDNLSIDGEKFKVELYILVKQGSVFNFVKFKEYTFEDEEMIVPPAPNGDGVVDFVLGSCNLSETDWQFTPWQNLPLTANVSISYPGVLLNSYWDVRFNSYTPAGSYDLPDAVTPWMQGWCGDKFTTIAAGTFDANIYPSLNNASWPAGMPFNISQIAQVNWLMNHLADFGYTLGNNNGGDGGPLQQAIWQLLNGFPAVHPTAIAMANAAASHGSFIPLPGGWAAVLIIKNDNPDLYQLIFVVVDP